MFEEVNNHPNFAKAESKILNYWKDNSIFAKSLEQRKDCEEFVFYDGPPFATGLPHYGHLLAGTIKDVIPRYQSMIGKYVDRTFGWDCHGLPVEYEMEQELKFKGKKDIEDYGIGKFNEDCRGIVLRYTAEWEKVVNRMGRWVDFENGYRTMDLDYMESIWWVFKQLWDKGLVYEGYKILPYCPRCATPLSNFEANQGYADVNDPAITVRFKLDDEDCYILAWTTTPWTLPSNMALAVGADIDYVKVKDGDDIFIIAEKRLSAYYKPEELPEVLEKFKGSELTGKTYQPLFSYFAQLAEEGAFKIVSADYVSTENGTGVVHIAPGFGEEDATVGKENGIPEVCPINESCEFLPVIEDYAGIFVKDADKDIIRQLKEEGKLVHRGTIRHSYPHCWRDDSPLIYKAISTWFVDIGRIKEKMLAANAQINWTPSHIKEGRFGKWLENARDWSISRNRYWGTPLPIWRNKETGEAICVGSVEELEQLSGVKVEDIHKHYTDDITIPSPTGQGVLTKVPEVLDCWFESGSMPYAQQHYPFENKERFEKNFPANFIAEGLDQTRGWFYTLVVLGAALFDKPSFKNVVVNGLILAEDGQKMSKRKKNYPDPSLVMDQYGADALRLFLLGSQVVRGEDLKFSEDGIKDVMRNVMIPMWNAYSFFVTYANVDKWEVPQGDIEPKDLKSPLDRWILSSMSQMIEEVRENMDNYNLQKAANRFEQFVDDLTNWYIRRSRRRFWKSQNDGDKQDAYNTLYYVLINFAQTAAPFIPFMTETIYQNLKTDDMAESVHLCDYPKPNTESRDEYLEEQMKNTMTAVSLGRFLRTKHVLKVRQPLKSAIIVVQDEKIREMLKKTSNIIAEELNVKEVLFHNDEEELVTRSAKANFKALGPKLGKNMKFAASEIAKLSVEDIASLLEGNEITISIPSDDKFAICADDIVIHREEKEGMAAATEGGVTIALDSNLTEELKDEGFAREFVSKIQNYRREVDFEVTDRIEIYYNLDEKYSLAIQKFKDYICNETLALVLENKSLENKSFECDINETSCSVFIKKSE